MTGDRSANAAEKKRVGITWVEAIGEALSCDYDDQTIEQYVDLVFGHPALVLADPDPDDVLDIVDQLLSRYPPMDTLGADASTADARTELADRLLMYTREGVYGDRPGPVGVVSEPDGSTASPPDTETPSSPLGSPGTQPGPAEGFAADNPDSGAMDIVELKDRITALSEEFDLSDDDVRVVLEELIDELEDTEGS
jgi:hypothetical protein